MRSRWSEQQIIRALQEHADEYGKAPSSNDWRRAGPDHPNRLTVLKVFGSWQAAVDAAGLQSDWTKSAIVAALQKDARRRGQPPTRNDWRSSQANRPRVKTIERVWGSWTNALKGAGLIAATTGEVKWTRERIIIALREDTAKHGSHPRPCDWRSKGPGRPTAQVVRRRFRSWGDAIHAANLHDTPERQSSQNLLSDSLPPQRFRGKEMPPGER